MQSSAGHEVQRLYAGMICQAAHCVEEMWQSIVFIAELVLQVDGEQMRLDRFQVSVGIAYFTL